MRTPFAVRLAFRESRSLRRTALLVAAVSAGVAALVAIESFTTGLQDSVREQSQALLGADLELGSASPFTPEAERTLAAIRAQAGPEAQLARTVSFSAMAFVDRTSGTRLVQVVAVEGGYPFYGEMKTDPPGAWAALTRGGGVIVDPSLLLSLDAKVGDTLSLGDSKLPIRAAVLNVPGDVGVRTAFGSRVFMAARDVPATGLLGFGARARHEAYLKLPESGRPQRLADRFRPALAAERVTIRTVSEDQESLNASLTRMGRYLGLVGLIALLLGGIAVASASEALLRRRIETIGVLRCLGATGPQVFAAYLLQAGGLALIGSAAGAAVGVAAQALLPRVVTGLVPVEVTTFAPSWTAIAWGVGLGVTVALLFAALPLLAIRGVSPLVVIRRSAEGRVPLRSDPLRLFAAFLLAAATVTIACVQAPTLRAGLGFAGGVGVALLALWAASWALTRVVRRSVPAGWPYVWRQGLANLHRPANQTVVVVLAMGFGAFLLDTLYVVQDNLLGQLRVDTSAERPNVVLIDIQEDQRDAVMARIRAAGVPPRDPVPIVPMRIQSVKGVDAARILAAPDGARRPDGTRSPRWAVRREYRSSIRDTPSATETTTAGERWAPGAWRAPADPQAPVPVSVEAGVARELDVGIGDEIVWDVQGLALRSRVAHLREVEWARFEPNFFVLFPEGPLDDAPKSYVTLSRIADPALRARFQREVVEAFPNVSVVDLTEVQKALEEVVGRVALAIRFMALFTLAAGAVVLVGAVAAGRDQRLREGALLKALGATRRQVLRILVAEYATLGLLASLAALALSLGAGWALARFLFESPFRVPAVPLLGLSAALVALTTGIGLWTSREVFARPVMETLRAEA
jgi:putative ABC transport system permease protein